MTARDRDDDRKALLERLRQDLETGWTPVRYESADGLALGGRDYRPAQGTADDDALPLLCLPGLTRNSKDFHVLARALSARDAGARRVVTLDLRGRGVSASDADARNYAPPVEAEDVIKGLDSLGIERAVILGTSRGGLVGTLIALGHPARVAGLILNDVGPVIETAGLKRISDYIVSPWVPSTWEAAAAGQKRQLEAFFPDFGDEDWMRFALQIYADVDGRPAFGFDPQLGATFADISFDKPQPDAWEFFDALAGVPLMALRGALSDILSAETVAEMAARRSDLRVVTVPRQGHAPVLWEDAVIAPIAAFLRECDAKAPDTAVPPAP
ncbi:alpha/beta fold hydrolase [Rhodobium gokarnense]|uniref:Pimeloyl-ACP methyl ester carboxylesterase n=1 Tax=Rhodobium gokarnense TaxID=364296 RepID=A0ABT3HG22_9HYPH|nr:alpha/beta hydrolase [Rhodobium gokarnense]MCW2309352.1 pimeloyl-ACP methyl ester carboxylesterase [Rhodobium gokarnense]